MGSIFLQNQIRNIDAETVVREGITSDQLMERASRTVSSWIFQNISPDRHIVVLAGPGNNGGDGLAVARHLALGFDVTVYSFTSADGRRSADNELNVQRLRTSRLTFHENDSCVVFPDNCLVIDALFGSGLSRPLEGLFADIVNAVNTSGCEVLSIDVPSGLGDEASLAHLDKFPVVKADTTISFQFRKMAFLLPETEQLVGSVVITDIGLDAQAIADTPTRYFYTEWSDVDTLFKSRSRFAHKGDFGRAKLFAGSLGMMGAAQLSARAALRSGVGLLTAVTPRCGYEIMQIGTPEAMVQISGAEGHLVWDAQLYDLRTKAIGIGPGIGRSPETSIFVHDAINAYSVTPKVIDADALWHLAQLSRDGVAPALVNAILTPHDAEFDNLTAPHSSRVERINAASDYAVANGVVVVLKGANTAVCLPDGSVHFNSTGNAGMATGGSGDVLTGILTALLAQGYALADAAILGVFIHGMAGDAAAQRLSQVGMTAGDIVDELSKLWRP